MFLVKAAYAQCPVCIVTVGGGMLLAKRLGVDDFLVSLWISALNTAISFWLAPRIKNKVLGNSIVFSLLMLGFTLFYFIYTDQTGLPTNKILGLDKIIFGQSLGLLIMFLGIFIDRYSRKLNNGKILFPYQKVVFPVGFLIIFTLLFKLLFKL
ncbi:MAG TPA: hypothetical protein PK257_02240 [Candidatus Woesebacteria bacterium]|nr:hypothetical protein [Candidatus Woesebacteria bacterium]